MRRADISFYLNELKHLNFKLNFHNEYKIICIEDLKELDWLQADYSVIDYMQKNGLSINLI